MTQKAAILPALDEDVVVRDHPIPTPNANQLLVKMTAAAVNPLDHIHRSISIRIKSYPAVLGCDGAGVVEEVGSAVEGFKKGDRVFFQVDFHINNESAAFQQYALADPKLVGRIPPNVTDEEASTLPTALATTVGSLFDKTGFAPPIDGPTVSNEPIVILGGSGSMGRSPRITGFSPIITTCSKQHIESVKQIGATHAFERTVTAEDIYSVLNQSGKPLRFVVDGVAITETQIFAYNLLTKQPNAPPEEELQIQVLLPPTEELLALAKSGRVKVGMVDGGAYMLRDLNAPFFAASGRWLEEGKLVPSKVQIIEGGLKSVPEALDTVAKGVSGAKLVIRPQE
ncbi:alcohol dehydrogenase [Ceratobasidium sp. AG-Ba]|nr:alcohol dehydrogenase [Ceratobasidium sp. AG-Ba]